MTTSTTIHASPGTQDLSRAQCLDLLRRSHLGRLAFADRVGVFPVVLPLTYVVHDGAVVLRAGSDDTLVAAVLGADVAFEVDRTDALGRTSWSVLVRGAVSEVVHPGQLDRVAGRLGRPADAASRHHLLRIDAEVVEGWRTRPGTGPGAWWEASR